MGIVIRNPTVETRIHSCQERKGIDAKSNRRACSSISDNATIPTVAVPPFLTRSRRCLYPKSCSLRYLRLLACFRGPAVGVLARRFRNVPGHP